MAKEFKKGATYRVVSEEFDPLVINGDVVFGEIGDTHVFDEHCFIDCDGDLVKDGNNYITCGELERGLVEEVLKEVKINYNIRELNYKALKGFTTPTTPELVKILDTIGVAYYNSSTQEYKNLGLTLTGNKVGGINNPFKTLTMISPEMFVYKLLTPIKSEKELKLEEIDAKIAQLEKERKIITEEKSNEK